MMSYNRDMDRRPGQHATQGGRYFVEPKSAMQRSEAREKAGKTSLSISLNNSTGPQEQLCRGESRAWARLGEGGLKRYRNWFGKVRTSKRHYPLTTCPLSPPV